MALVAFLVYAALCVAAMVGPRFLPGSRRLRLGLALFALAGILAKAALVAFRETEVWFDGLDLWVFFERDLAVPFGAAFFAFIAALVPDERSRRAVRLMPGVLLLYLVVNNAWVFTRPACYTKSDGFWNKGVCIQSTDYTCGAASIATLLRAKGLRTTEHEAAELSATIPGRGVTDLGAAMALRRALPGHRVTLRRVALDALHTATAPALLPLRYSFWFDHMTVLLGVEKDVFIVGDPIVGPTRMKRVELEPRFLGHVITVD